MNRGILMIQQILLSIYYVQVIVLGAESFITSFIFTSLSIIFLLNPLFSHISEAWTCDHDLDSN